MVKKDAITAKQAICIIILFVFGRSAILGGSTKVGQDTWIPLIASILLVMPALLLYSRIIKLFPESDIFDIVITVFGNIAGRIFIVLFSAYAIHLSALVLRNYSGFVKITTMPETPELPLLLLMTILISYIVYCGTQTLGKWAAVILPVILGIVLITVVLAVGQMKFSNICPIMSHNLTSIADTTLLLFSFPFAETVLFLTIASSVKKGESPYKIYTLGVLFGGLILLIIFFRNLFILGAPLIVKSYFPSYTAIRVIKLGDFLSRLEATMSVNFFLGGITKSSVCLLGAVKGVTRLFNIKNSRKVILPVSAVVLALSYFMFENVMQMVNNIEFYKFYGLIPELLLPLIIWIGAEVKSRKMKSREEAGE